MMETSHSGFLRKLAELRTQMCDRVPTPQLATLTRLTARLRRSGMLRHCLQPGETAPDFEIPASGGAPGSLYGLLATGPVVLSFYRGIWCTWCRTELEAYEALRQELDAEGCHYLAISPENPTAAGSSEAGEHSQGPGVVHDEANHIARLFGLVYELEAPEIALLEEWGLRAERVNSAGRWELPLPATYLIARNRSIAYQFVDADFRARCCPDDLLAELRALQGAAPDAG